MEIYERIRELRKNHLKVSMETFGKKLGVSRDIINNIELNRLARPEQKLSLYKLICSEFGVSEEWLLNGTGEMFSDSDTKYDSLIDQIMSGENEFAKNIFKAFALFDEKDWEALKHMIEIYISVSDTTALANSTLTSSVDEAEAAYIKSRSNTVQSMDSQTSNLNIGIGKDNKLA